MLEEKMPNTRVKNYLYQDFQDDDEEDFEVKTMRDERLIDSLPERDDECAFDRDMYNFGEAEDLPDSDRAMDKRCKN